MRLYRAADPNVNGWLTIDDDSPVPDTGPEYVWREAEPWEYVWHAAAFLDPVAAPVLGRMGRQSRLAVPLMRLTILGVELSLLELIGYVIAAIALVLAAIALVLCVWLVASLYIVALS